MELRCPLKSPFPGMDPYLEAHWGDVHTRLIVYSGDQFRPQLPTDLANRETCQAAVFARSRRRKDVPRIAKPPKPAKIKLDGSGTAADAVFSVNVISLIPTS